MVKPRTAETDSGISARRKNPIEIFPVQRRP